MAKKTSIWLTLLSGAFGAAIFTFIATKAWEIYQHRPVGPDYVQASIRFEDDKLLLFVRNNSDEPLDLKRAAIAIDDPSLVESTVLGAYPEISKIYTVSTSKGGHTNLEVMDNGLMVTVDISQAIPAKDVDQFAITLNGLAGPVDLSRVKLHASLEDMKGNRYFSDP